MNKKASNTILSTSASQRMGAAFEDRACLYLCDAGLSLIARNWLKSGVGELDLIMQDTDGTLVFVEVRARAKNSLVFATESITPVKRQRIIHAAQHFLMMHDEYAHCNCRFDVIGFDGEELTWVRSAFLSE